MRPERAALSWLLLLSAVVLLVSDARAAQTGLVGFESTEIAGADGQGLSVGIWYPSVAPGSAQRLGPYRQTVAPDAPLRGRDLPLVVVSHGSGGWFGGHFDTALALARAGFVVAALTHKGDSSQDGSQRAEIWIRPPQLVRLIDFMLRNWRDHNALAPDRVGAFGFSAGGFTALVAAGGTPDLGRVLTYCDSHPATQTCGVVRSTPESFREQATHLPASAWKHDERIRAIVVAAPALGFTFNTRGLAAVTVPVQLWRAEHDQVLPYPDYADAVRAALPVAPEFHVMDNAGHYDFMAPCPALLVQEAPEICAERPGFDRVKTHQAFNREVVRFFLRTLAREAGPARDNRP